MKAQVWSKREIDKLFRLLSAGHGASEIAALLERTEASVRYKILNLGYSSRRVEGPEATNEFCGDPGSSSLDEMPVLVEQLRAHAGEQLKKGEERREIRNLVNEYKSDVLEERILDEFRQRLLDLPLRIDVPPLRENIVTKHDIQDLAVVVISDSHIGQVVDIRETESSSAYNPAVFVARLHHLEIELARIFNSHPVKEIVVLFAGDIVHGRLGHSLEDDLTLPIATQIDLALHLFVQFLARIATMAKRVTVHGVAGNHGRWPGTRKMPTDRRWSQLDTLFFQAAQALCGATLPNVVFDERFSARRMVDVEDFRILLLHGDQLRGGPCAANGVQKEMQLWLMRCVQTGQRPPDLIVLGDKHISANLPVGLGQALINGSFVGEDVFSQNFAPSPPSQSVFFVRPGVGKTETHLIRLDKAKLPTPLPYQLKPSLESVVMNFHQAHQPPKNSL
jgi:predicted phosphodiesterase